MTSALRVCVSAVDLVFVVVLLFFMFSWWSGTPMTRLTQLTVRELEPSLSLACERQWQ